MEMIRMMTTKIVELCVVTSADCSISRTEVIVLAELCATRLFFIFSYKVLHRTREITATPVFCETQLRITVLIRHVVITIVHVTSKLDSWHKHLHHILLPKLPSNTATTGFHRFIFSYVHRKELLSSSRNIIK